ncbi:hypothetical protein [uncultured Muriicola sp.]|uniref:hypothetical protein n=1 Tax=uncultured Muriicola sp. TaxID=1583102 RepID=UPI002615E626|nr:hypothetical protein [uncultured Muriicola sp.]
MAKRLGTIALYFFTLSVCMGVAQDIDPLEDDALVQFQNESSVSDRFTYFFATVNRYNSHSAYDWLDTVDRYIKNSEKAKDSLAIKKYKLIQSQIFFDIGDYDKSVSLSTKLYTDKHELDLKTKELLLDLLDANYSRLQLYDKQVEIRKQKRELGLKNNISFYDIYSNLGLHRQAMKDYIMENQKTVEDNDFFGLANYHNSIGNYLLLDKSTSTALTNFSKAKGYIEVFLNGESDHSGKSSQRDHRWQ